MIRQSDTAISHHFSSQLYQSTAPFSHFVRHGDTGYTAGIIGQDPSSGALVSSDVTEQCAAMLANLESLLNELGLGMSHIIRMTIYLTDYQDFDAINTVYAQRLTPPFPARTTVQAAGLPLGAKVQIEATVHLPNMG
ncbi:RidA family protein [Pseudarthrobacter sp. CC4]|uniref:RidA family protein n=1 Tax=Pseudarthrobacter TaxID=1742993 RepID=UPI002AA72F59|nr:MULTISPECIES: RidA family protein [Pseudarthrobacter]MEA3551027.1 RidA family protein [Pseudarthrobacter sp. C1]WPU11116.1 RidA family protein [Pseudarthrobacter oxydans]